MKGNTNDAINRAVATATTKNLKDINWYFPQYTPNVTQQSFLSELFVSRAPTELHYIETSVCRKDVNSQNDCTFELGVQNAIGLPIYGFVGSQVRNWLDNQEHDNDLFTRLPLSCVQCIIITGEYTNAGIILNYDDDSFSQNYGKIVSCFEHLTRANFLLAYITRNYFGSDNAYNLYVFDILH